MIFDSNGFVRDAGATDWMDSARLAGMMAIVDHEYAPRCIKYIDDFNIGCRYPNSWPANDPKIMSRDQLICLMAGIWVQGDLSKALEVHDKYKNNDWRCFNTHDFDPEKNIIFPSKYGADILSPAARGHLKRCAGLKSSWFEDAWLGLDVMYHALVTPMAEPNQLISMLVVAGPKWVGLWKMMNRRWKESVMEYWGGWRGESELGERIVERQV
jgi:hypothetical protein